MSLKDITEAWILVIASSNIALSAETILLSLEDDHSIGMRSKKFLE